MGQRHECRTKSRVLARRRPLAGMQRCRAARDGQSVRRQRERVARHRPAVQRPALQPHRRIPAPIDPDGDRGAEGVAVGGRLRRRDDRGSSAVLARQPGAVPGGGVPADHRRRARRRRAGRLRGVDRRGRKLRRRALCRRHRARLAVLRHAGGRVFRQPPRRPAGQRRHRGDGQPDRRRSAVAVAAHRRVVQLRRQPAPQRHRAGDRRRIDVHGRHDGRRPSDHLAAPDGRRRPRILHRPGPHRRQLPRSAATSACWSAGCAGPRAAERRRAAIAERTPTVRSCAPPWRSK